MKVLVTGATGFIGRALCARFLKEDRLQLVATARSPDQVDGIGPINSRELGPDTDWQDLLDCVDVVVHTAARVHVTRGPENLAAFRQVNVEGTLNLARQAADCGVRRFVFLSSVKVNGESTPQGSAFSAADQPAPNDAYGVSKYEAEVGLSSVAQESGMAFVTIRAPLVYGPGVKANLFSLMQWVYGGYPLPFARVKNLRSLVALDNLTDLVRICCTHELAANETFMAADGTDVSTTELVIRLGHALSRPARLFAMPKNAMLRIATLIGKRDQATKLLNSLQVDIRKTCDLLQWKPIITMDRQLESMASHYLDAMR